VFCALDFLFLLSQSPPLNGKGGYSQLGFTLSFSIAGGVRLLLQVTEVTLWDAVLDASSQNLIARVDAGVLSSVTRTLTNVHPLAVFQHQGSNRGPLDTVGSLGVATLGDAVAWSEAIVIEGRIPPFQPPFQQPLSR
jgi:hypothetical protein